MITHHFFFNLTEEAKHKFGFYKPQSSMRHWVNAKIVLQKDKIQNGSWQIISSSLSFSKLHDKYKLKIILRPEEILLSKALSGSISSS